MPQAGVGAQPAQVPKGNSQEQVPSVSQPGGGAEEPGSALMACSRSWEDGCCKNVGSPPCTCWAQERALCHPIRPPSLGRPTTLYSLKKPALALAAFLAYTCAKLVTDMGPDLGESREGTGGGHGCCCAPTQPEPAACGGRNAEHEPFSRHLVPPAPGPRPCGILRDVTGSFQNFPQETAVQEDVLALAGVGGGKEESLLDEHVR